jgi:ADP-ribosyl-[dinitrogen reductase] hydrolase
MTRSTAQARLCSVELVRDRAVGSLVGLVVGDALGTTVEFRERGSFRPLTDIVGAGPFGLRKGEWTDDTSMALCLAEALIEGKGDLHPHRLLQLFLEWYQSGRNSVTGVCFDIGTATRAALETFASTGTTENNTAPEMQANGSIMRLAPSVICAADRETALHLAVAQGRTTHAAPVPSKCCEELASLLWDLIETGRADSLGNSYVNRTSDSVVSSGHAPASLDAARWSVATTDNFSAALLRAVNLGDDADTVGAIAGQIAGGLYGVSGIPAEWLETIAWRERIVELAESLWKIRMAKAG